MNTKTELLQIEEIQIQYKPLKNKYPKINNSQSVNEVLKIVFEEEMNYRENFYISLLNNQNQILGIKLISTGGMKAAVVDVRIILQTALLSHATSIILAHNHPSGQLKPSQADKNITAKIKKAAQQIDVNVLDHLIFSREGYLSFADEGIL